MVESKPRDLPAWSSQTTRPSRAIRKSAGQTARVPIIGLSAGAFAQDERTALEAGMDGYLVKPVHREELAAAIARVRAGLSKTS